MLEFSSTVLHPPSPYHHETYFSRVTKTFSGQNSKLENRVWRQSTEKFQVNQFFAFCKTWLQSPSGTSQERQEAQLSLRDRATRACQLKSGKVLHKCRRLVFEKL